MNKISLALNFILLILVFILFSKVSSLEKKGVNMPENTPKNTGTQSSFNDLSKMVYINIDSLDANFDMVKDMRKDLEAEKTKSENSLKVKFKALEQEYMKAQEEAKYYTQTQAATKQAELVQKEQNLMKEEQELTEKLQLMEMDKNKKLQQTVQQALKDLKKDYNFEYVFGYNGWGNLLFAGDSLDITPQVLKYLNEQHAKKEKQ